MQKDIPYIAFEAELARNERIIHGLIKIIIFLVICEFLTVAGFLYFESIPVEEQSITQEADNESTNNIIGGDNYGSTTDSDLQEENTSQTE